MRIIAGKMKGSKLYFPKTKNTRPLKDLARESILNLLIHSNNILFKFKNSIVLDLFSGTGSFGLECLSREAQSVCFVEKEKNILKILKKNIEKLKLQKNTKIFSTDVFDFIKKKKLNQNKYDLIFCDPPFKKDEIKKLVDLIAEEELLKKDGIIVIHRNRDDKNIFPNSFKLIEEREYGISKIIFGKL